METDLDSFGARFVQHIIKNHGPVTKDEIAQMCNMRLLDVIPFVAIMCDRDIVTEIDDGYVITENPKDT